MKVGINQPVKKWQQVSHRLKMTLSKVSVQKVTLRKKCPLIIGDFNVEPNEANVKAFCSQYKLKSLKKDPTCFKNVNKLSCIDLFLTNNSKFFENCLTLETGLSDFHHYDCHHYENKTSTPSSKNHKLQRL